MNRVSCSLLHVWSSFFERASSKISVVRKDEYLCKWEFLHIAKPEAFIMHITLRRAQFWEKFLSRNISFLTDRTQTFWQFLQIYSSAKMATIWFAQVSLCESLIYSTLNIFLKVIQTSITNIFYECKIWFYSCSCFSLRKR